jgi:hypothetical protein
MISRIARKELIDTYNVLSGENEQGTLPLALSQPVSLATIASSKVALRALSWRGSASTASADIPWSPDPVGR